MGEITNLFDDLIEEKEMTSEEVIELLRKENVALCEEIRKYKEKLKKLQKQKSKKKKEVFDLLKDSFLISGKTVVGLDTGFYAHVNQWINIQIKVEVQDLLNGKLLVRCLKAKCLKQF